ncbi:hypothetical protein BGZ63DRAFT_421950 [Mariannaea sp. PMI_226]|nr:hypothetical protein BGZ63DRAFT_421950 [Mariannaea sp. PMI_226]
MSDTSSRSPSPWTPLSAEGALAMEELHKEFGEYVQKRSVLAKDGFGQEVEYIASVALKEFWDFDRVNSILTTLEVKERPEQIIANFTHIFSILVYISRPTDIGLFTPRLLDDQHLPLTSRPTDWPTTPRNDDLYETFRKHQWRFCPLEFRNGYMHKRYLEPQMILPVKYKEQLSPVSAGGDESVVFKVEVDKDCNETLPSSTVVFKVYSTEEAKDLFKAEADAYTSILAEHADYITMCYGSFEQNGKYTIILEYAPRGTLLDFWLNTHPPHDTAELTRYWRASFQLLQGLELIHEVSRLNKPSRWVWSMTHHDIKPANILVFPSTPDTSDPYDVKFKLTDFGTTRITKKLAGADHSLSLANNGNRMYTAPECCRTTTVQEHWSNRVEPTVDVWALGAVLSDGLIWSIWGESGRDKYRNERQREIAQIPALKGSGYDACFHNGIHRLEAVDATHQLVLDHSRKIDSLSEVVSELILEHMLQGIKGRLSPSQTFNKFEAKFDRWKRFQESTNTSAIIDRSDHRPTNVSLSTSSANNTHPKRQEGIQREPKPSSKPVARLKDAFNSCSSFSQQTGSFCQHHRSTSVATHSNPEFNKETSDNKGDFRLSREEIGRGRPPEQNTISNGNRMEQLVSFKDVYMHLTTKRHRSMSFSRMLSSRRGISTNVMNLVGISEALSKIDAFGSRDQYILIDNYESMKDHKLEVEIAARVISYYVKEVHSTKKKNAIQLYFASEMGNPSKHGTSSSVETAIRHHEFIPGYCAMNLSLRNILEKIAASPKPSSVYVFTDAVWEPGPCEVGRVIAEAVSAMVEKRLKAQDIMIQFIRFGDGIHQRERLRKLDDDLVTTYDLDQAYDIVDTKSYNSNVPDILVGSISSHHDGKSSDASR